MESYVGKIRDLYDGFKELHAPGFLKKLGKTEGKKKTSKCYINLNKLLIIQDDDSCS